MLMLLYRFVALGALLLSSGAGAGAAATHPSGSASFAGFDLSDSTSGHERLRAAPLPSSDGSMALAFDAVRSSNYHTVAPGLMLREERSWKASDGTTVYEGTMRIGHPPHRGESIIAEIDATTGLSAGAETHRVSRLRLSIDGDTIRVQAFDPDMKALDAVGGTMTRDRIIAFRIAVGPSGRTEVVVNGTRGIFALPVAEPLSFQIGLTVEQDIGQHPDPVDVRMLGLTAEHHPRFTAY
ncbi:hypothetical protein [Brytella acorum]|uniref:Alginate lyase 2 domain-containing protein n=1 Tax=Brytella acorum TaxID=2959299 RepID=A0AA35V1L9_9PROT|nr:hypothetical protein [Brytella acorum]MDF3625119.1 hypothetical protein [Brytella acorum]CAI9121002.1 hypothetical protein LMG32879_001846 [Brytella acorum]